MVEKRRSWCARHTEIVDDGSSSLGNSVKVLYEVIQGREGMEAKNIREA
jgi:cold shock CspA family protein